MEVFWGEANMNFYCKLSLKLLIILAVFMVVSFCFMVQHEKVHKIIYENYGINSTIKYHFFSAETTGEFMLLENETYLRMFPYNITNDYNYLIGNPNFLVSKPKTFFIEVDCPTVINNLHEGVFMDSGVLWVVNYCYDWKNGKLNETYENQKWNELNWKWKDGNKTMGRN